MLTYIMEILDEGSRIFSEEDLGEGLLSCGERGRTKDVGGFGGVAR